MNVLLIPDGKVTLWCHSCIRNSRNRNRVCPVNCYQVHPYNLDWNSLGLPGSQQIILLNYRVICMVRHPVFHIMRKSMISESPVYLSIFDSSYRKCCWLLGLVNMAVCLNLSAYEAVIAEEMVSTSGLRVDVFPSILNRKKTFYFLYIASNWYQLSVAITLHLC